MATHAPPSPIAAPAALGAPPAADRPAAHRGRLFRKYLVLIISLVASVVLVSGGIGFRFSYLENKSALADLQHEKAIAAAARIEQYMQQIERQLTYAALPQIDPRDIELRRIEFLKVLRQAPEVTDIALLDGTGHEQLIVSRLGMDVPHSGKDRSQEPAFRGAKRGQPWYGPVYFRKETEPYITIAVRSGSDTGPVTVADVNLKFIWDVVSRIHIGDKGKAYVVDNTGYLVADPDIGLVLRKTYLGNLPHIRNATTNGDEAAVLSTDLTGATVLTSFAPIASLDWKVFVEQPAAEVYAKLNASILRTAMLLLGGLVISAVAAMALARSMVRPIRTLHEGARRIGAGQLDQKIVVRTNDELEGLADEFNRMTGQLRESYAGLERKVDERTHELSNALEQQTAISEILRVISGSPTDVRPVLQAVAERAAHLCEAPYARVMVIEGDALIPMAHDPPDPGFVGDPVPLARTSITGRAVVDRATFHVDDIVPIAEHDFPGAVGNIRRLGCRAVLAVPLLREGGAYGGIFLFRREPGFFSPDQVALVQTFARQAAIAIENVRLFNETKEALDQQTAISEILRVISSSPGDVKPMLDAVAERALHLCEAAQAGIFLVEGDALRYAAGFGDMLTPQENSVYSLTRRLVIGRAALDRQTIHVPDVVPLLDSDYPDARPNQEKYGFRALLAVPLLREDRAIGAIALWRREPRDFSDKQIALVKTFADQAAIGIENVRLFNETKEALDQQTAISEILRVISSSPGDVKPMLDAVAERALRLCDAAQSNIFLVDDDALRFVAGFGGMTTFEEGELTQLTRERVVGRATLDRETIHIPDIMPLVGEYPMSRMNQDRHRLEFRAVLAVPLMRENRAIGAISLWRPEAKPFTDKQIALIKTFADQAAIAIENARLFAEVQARTRELQESLEYQTAASDVLNVISRSPSNIEPVLDAIADTAQRLCQSEHVFIMRLSDGAYHVAVARNATPEQLAFLRAHPFAPDRGSITGRVALEGRAIQVADVLADAEYTKSVDGHRGFRTTLGVPLLRAGVVIGVIVLTRSVVRTFSPKQIDLITTFADQAVIAIENARLFNETKEALEQQTAISEILQVISSSPTDVQPVLDAIAERAARQCDASSASMYLIDGQVLRHLASKGSAAEPVTHVDTLPIDARSVSGRALLTRTTLQIDDMLAETAQYPLSAELAQRYGHRSVVVMPLFREGRPFGTILLRRQEVRPFNEREINLLRTFGDQAAIALENVRLFNETREALEQQRASGEVLAAISSSIADTTPVFERILEACERLFAGKSISINVLGDDGLIRIVAHHGPHRDEVLAAPPVPADGRLATGVCIATRSVLHFPDAEDEAVPPLTRQSARMVGAKAAVFAPMVWEGKGIGSISVGRDFKGPFSEKDIALLRTFADQAVIAIQNARLFHEIEDKSRQLEIANKHKSEFLANMSHELRTPLNAIIGFSEVLRERLFGDVNEKQDDYLKDIHSSGRHLLSLINDILDLSKIEAGRMELEPSTFELRGVMENALTLVRERAQRHEILLGLDVAADIGDVTADERKLKQILVTLLTNAVKFTPDGGRVDVNACRDGADIVIAVADTGIGIAPEDQEAVFEEFRQVGRSYTNKQEGTGLGLALTRKFVELHGGRIRLESTPGKGSTFTFTLPSRQ
jgi:GAF domain-containing protein/HAMP domain-containing protein